MARVAIVGVGLIGASVGLRLSQTSQDTELVGFDPDAAHASSAARIKAVHQVARTLQEAVEGASVVIVCVPVSAVEAVFREMSNHLAKGALVTDTASLKEEVLAFAERELPRHVDFVGGDPLVHVGAGPEGARFDLFEGHEYAVIPSPSAHHESVETVVRLVESLGARPYFIESAEHDSLVALTTQAPEVLAAALLGAQAGLRSKPDMARFLMRPFYDVARLLADGHGSSNEDAWGYVANEARLGKWIESVVDVLNGLRNSLRDSDVAGVASLLNRASKERSTLLAVDVPSADSSKLDIPTSAEHFGELLMGSHLMERQKRILRQASGEQVDRKEELHEDKP